jgi:hypothetical protein
MNYKLMDSSTKSPPERLSIKLSTSYVAIRKCINGVRLGDSKVRGDVISGLVS